MSDVITNLPPKVRFSLRGPTALDGTGDFSLPTRIGEIAVTGASVALCLGPDEWILEADDGAEAIAEAFAGSNTPHSLVEISDRALSLKLTGPEALALLEMGCPRDLRTIPEGEAARTVCHGIEVILWHETDGWRVDAWRSFMPYLRGQLEHGVKELATGV
ncbi:sarcosine oxidase subunit gamma [Paracoccaceae bacterium GXU_MW_L88]